MRIGANLLDTPGRRPYPVAPAHHALQSIHCMATSPFKQPGTEHPFGTETHREHPPLEVVHRADTPMEGVPAVTAGDPEVAQAVVPEPPPEAAPPEPPQPDLRPRRRQLQNIKFFIFSKNVLCRVVRRDALGRSSGGPRSVKFFMPPPYNNSGPSHKKL